MDIASGHHRERGRSGIRALGASLAKGGTATLALGAALLAAYLHGVASVPNAVAQPAAPERPPVVMLILDEFPGDNILGPDGRIDGVRFPALAGLANRATWYPNASTVYTATSRAVPAILTGRRPPPRSAPDEYSSESIYAALSRAGYVIVDGEETTHVCPPELCAAREIRPRPCRVRNCVFVGHGRVTRFDRWLRSIRPTSSPTIWVKHLLIPHRPWIYLPDGATTQSSYRLKGPVRGMNRFGGPRNAFLRMHNLQRHLLQLRFADLLLGRLLSRLERQAMLDDALVVITSDHGYSFVGGLHDHRHLSAANVHQIAPIPLLMKAPEQEQPDVDLAYATNVDIAATITDLLGLPLGYETDGAPLSSEAVRLRGSPPLVEEVGLSTVDYEAHRVGSRSRRLRLFGFGRHGFWDGIGPNRELVGEPLSRLRVRHSRSESARFVSARLLHRVRRSSGIVPIHVAGDLRARHLHGELDLAVAVNGRIEAVGRSFTVAGHRTRNFAMLIPPRALHEGRNRVSLFEVRGARTLDLLGAAP
jgi:hypothetical protein